MRLTLQGRCYTVMVQLLTSPSVLKDERKHLKLPLYENEKTEEVSWLSYFC